MKHLGSGNQYIPMMEHYMVAIDTGNGQGWDAEDKVPCPTVVPLVKLGKILRGKLGLSDKRIYNILPVSRYCFECVQLLKFDLALTNCIKYINYIYYIIENTGVGFSGINFLKVNLMCACEGQSLG